MSPMPEPMPEWSAHPLAERMPEMTPDEFTTLKGLIELSGQQEPIVLLDGQILDGRHRYKACVVLGIMPTFREFGSLPTDGPSPELFVISKNSGRSLTAVQKAVVAETFLDDIVEGRMLKDHDKKRSSEHAAKLFGVSRAYVDQVRQVRKSSPKLYDGLRVGKLSLKAALQRLSHRSREEQVRELRKPPAIVTPENCRLLHGDNRDVMRTLPDGSVRIIFLDPPYNNGWTYRNDPGHDQLDDADYLRGLSEAFEESQRLLTDDGSIFVVIDDRYSDEVGIELKAQGFHFRRIIVWWETFGNYASGETNLSPACRFIHYYTKSDQPFFNTTELRDPSARQMVYGDKRANALGKIPDSVWPASRICGNNAERVPWQDAGQAPQLPISVPERCILLASEPGDLVLDAYNGNGTTGIAALRNGRRYIGIDRDAVGLGRSERWINQQLAASQTKGD